MRKGTCAIAVALTLALPALATPAAAQVDLGVRGGIASSELVYEDLVFDGELRRRTGVLAGVFAEVPLAGGLSLQPGLHYVQKGSELQEGAATRGLRLGYAELPVLLRYAFPISGSAGLHLTGGPALAYEVSCKNTIASGSAEATVGCRQGGLSDEEVRTKSVDLGVMGGAGLSLAMDRRTLLIDAFYNHGLRNIRDEEQGEARNRAFYVTAGIRFPTGG